MEAEGLRRVRLAGAKGSGKQQGTVSPRAPSLSAQCHEPGGSSCSGSARGWTPAPSSHWVVDRLATRDPPTENHGDKWADSEHGSEHNISRVCSRRWQGRYPERLRWVGGTGSVSGKK